jgi:hypothetical protein
MCHEYDVISGLTGNNNLFTVTDFSRIRGWAKSDLVLDRKNDVKEKKALTIRLVCKDYYQVGAKMG